MHCCQKILCTVVSTIECYRSGVTFIKILMFVFILCSYVVCTVFQCQISLNKRLNMGLVGVILLYEPIYLRFLTYEAKRHDPSTA